MSKFVKEEIVPRAKAMAVILLMMACAVIAVASFESVIRSWAGGDEYRMQHEFEEEGTVYYPGDNENSLTIL